MTIFLQQTAVVLSLLSISGALGYIINEYFWRTPYARNNKEGIAGGPFGGIFIWVSGSLIGFLMTLAIGPFFMEKEAAACVAFGCLVVGVITGYFPMSKKRGEH
ncbi:MAG: hypothetical protein JSS83_28740 [Cyanobacteria bacterium SZAS LIN-3]|nr:hypothetical protein [Cyanobacteria bacterium SZAS LIN-3]MBS2005985.1 hypothetical protein [Cyanobacteria bacterium SZAS TMP-1]